MHFDTYVSGYCPFSNLTTHVQHGSSDNKFSGLGLVGPADVNTRMVAPSVPNHQVCGEDEHISGNGLSICSEKTGESQMTTTKSSGWPRDHF